MPVFDLSRLLKETFVESIDFHSHLKSTNDRAIELINSGLIGTAAYTCPTLVLAEIQTQGRGQRGRHWIADKGSLTFSLCLQSNSAAWETAIPSGVGLAVCRAIEKRCGRELEILKLKWPNDILIKDCKVGGILVEKVGALTESDCDALSQSDSFSRSSSNLAASDAYSTRRVKSHLVIGIGLNVNNWIQAMDLPDDPWNKSLKKVLKPTSLVEACGQSFDLTLLLIDLIGEIQIVLSELATDLSSVIDAVYNRLVFAQRCITVQQPGGRIITGVLQGLTPKGYLVIEGAGKPYFIASGQIIDWERE